MRRRKVLAVSGASIATVLAGCSDNGDDDPEAQDDTGEDPEDEPDEGAETAAQWDDSELIPIAEIIESDIDLFDGQETELTGDGDGTTDAFSLDDGLTVVVAEFEDEGTSNYQLELGGDLEDLVLNALEGGTHPLAIPTPGGDYEFEVTAPSGWDLTVGQPTAPEELIRTAPVEIAGERSDVVGPIELEGETTMSASYDGEGNFQVMVYAEGDSDAFDGDLVFNEIDEFEDDAETDYDGVCWIQVEADGEWTLEVED